MFPVLRPRPKVEDPAPLVRVPSFDPVAADGSSVRALALSSFAMLGLAGLVIAAGRKTVRHREEVG
jgi:hypothetical protein